MRKMNNWMALDDNGCFSDEVSLALFGFSAGTVWEGVHREYGWIFCKKKQLIVAT